MKTRKQNLEEQLFCLLRKVHKLRTSVAKEQEEHELFLLLLGVNKLWTSVARELDVYFRQEELEFSCRLPPVPRRLRQRIIGKYESLKNLPTVDRKRAESLAQTLPN